LRGEGTMTIHKHQTRVLGAIILLTMLFSLIFPTSTVFADDTTPPADTTEVVDSPAGEDASPEEEVPADNESVTEEPTVEAPAADEVVTEEAPTEEPPVDEVVTEEPVAEVAVTEESLTEEATPEGTVADGTFPMEELQSEAESVIAQLPEGTDMVVLDEAGVIVPLVTQEAAEVIASSDPMWCPDGVNPVANTDGCTDSYGSLTDLLSALSGSGQPTQNGTIWIEKTYDSSVAEPGSTTNITIDGNNGNFSSWRDYSLTVQGGWDGTGSGTISGTSLFSDDRFRIINWQNNVTIRDIVFDGASGGASLEVEIDTPSANTYNVTLDNVEAKNNVNNIGAYIDNDESTGHVTVNNSKFTNNGDNDDGLQIYAMGNVSLLNISANGNGDEGVQISNMASSTAATVQVLGTNLFTGNKGDGLYIRSEGVITLNNITADGNNDNGIDIDNCIYSSGACQGSGNVTVTGTNSFSGNTNNGMNVISMGSITLSNIIANGNTNGTGANLVNDYTGSVGGVTITGANSFNSNYNSGLVIDTRNAVSLANITADGNIRGSGVYLDNCNMSSGVCQGSGDVALTGTLAFTNNGNGGDRGLYVYSNGNVTMADVTATGNIGNGVEINNASNATSTTSATITIGGTNVFTGNVGYGLRIDSKGNVGLNNLTADTNNYGTYIYNNTSTTNATVTLTGANSFSGNTYEGLYIYSKGAIDLSNITANGNTNGNTSGTGAYLRNDYTGAVGGVSISGTNSFSGNDASGLVIDSRGAVSLNNIIANSNIYGNGVNIENCNYSSGVCQGSGDVTLTGTLFFTNNGDNDDGLVISTSGNVSMANVTATGNGDEGVQVSNTNSTTNAFVQISGTNVFSGNMGYGLYVNSKGAITASNVTANGSTAYGGAYLDNDETGAVGGVSLTGSNSFSDNDDYGLQVYSLGAIGLNNITANNNVTQFGANIYNAGTNASGSVTITGTNSVSGNDDYGMQIYSKGSVSLEYITANGNLTQDGLNIDNCNWGGSSVGCRGSGDVTISGTNSFSNNGNGGGDFGLNINSGSAVTVENVTANSNKDSGVYIDNTRSSTDATVTMNGINTVSNNLNDGLVIYSDGTINVNEITADSNGAGRDDAGARLDNDTGTGDVIVTGYYNSFSNNTGPGLYISTKGAIELFFATITGNNTWAGSQNGAVFTSPGATSNLSKVYCSIFGNNNGYGLDAWNFEDSLTFVGQNSFSGNPSGDYRFNGSASFEDPDYLCEEPVLGCTEPNSINYDPSANTNDGSCIPIVLGCTDPTAFNYNLVANTDNNSCLPVIRGCMDPEHPAYNPEANTPRNCKEETPKTLASSLIPVTGGQLTAISCEAPITKLLMAGGDFVAFTSLCGYDALLDDVPQEGLPEGLPNGSQFVSALSVALTQDGKTIEPLPDGTSMTVAFKIPAGMVGANFSILRWDGSTWMEEGVSLEIGHVKTNSSNTGTFVLVVK
jgi:hypothetical protein